MIDDTVKLAATVETVTSATFDAIVLAGHGPIAVEFMSYGCSHCRVIEPIVARVAERLGTHERVLRVNIGIEQGLAERYDVRGTPTFVMFLDGRIVGRVEGPQPNVASLTKAITEPFAT